MDRTLLVCDICKTKRFSGNDCPVCKYKPKERKPKAPLPAPNKGVAQLKFYENDWFRESVKALLEIYGVPENEIKQNPHPLRYFYDLLKQKSKR